MPTIGPRYMHAIHAITLLCLESESARFGLMMGIIKFFLGFYAGAVHTSFPIISGDCRIVDSSMHRELHRAHKMYVCSYLLGMYVPLFGRFLPRRESPLAKHGKGKPYWNICREKSLFFIKVLREDKKVQVLNM
jgi:hypothetical protein